MPASAKTATESGTASVVLRTTGGATDAATGGDAGSGATVPVTVAVGGRARAAPGRRGGGAAGDGAVGAGAGRGAGGVCVGGGGGCVVGGGGCVVGVVSGTLVVVSGATVVVAGAVGSDGVPAASAVPAHSNSAIAPSAKVAAVTTPRGRALRGDVIRNISRVHAADSVGWWRGPLDPHDLCPPHCCMCWYVR